MENIGDRTEHLERRLGAFHAHSESKSLPFRIANPVDLAEKLPELRGAGVLAECRWVEGLAHPARDHPVAHEGERELRVGLDPEGGLGKATGSGIVASLARTIRSFSCLASTSPRFENRKIHEPSTRYALLSHPSWR